MVHGFNQNQEVILLSNLLKAMTRRIIIEIISFWLIFLFLYAATSKLLDFQKFSIHISQSPLLTKFADIIPSAIIVSEILASLLLIFPRFRLAGFFTAFSLMTMFTAYIVAILGFSDY